MTTSSSLALDDALGAFISAAALYEAARVGVEIAVAGRWEVELAVRQRLRELGPGIHEDARARLILEAWLIDAVGRMRAGTAAMHVRVAGRGLVKTALEEAWAT